MIERIMELLEQTNCSNIEKQEIQKYLENTADDALFLEALESNGVDNWEWYSEAYNDYMEWKKDDNADAEEEE